MTRPRLRIGLLAVFLLAACSGSAQAVEPPPTHDPRPDQWTIGPIIDGRDYSSGVPLHPTADPGGSWHIDLPRAPGSVHYVTFRYGPLTGRKRIVLRYRVDAAPGVRLVPATAPRLPSIITLYFQRRGDDWSAAGRFEAYRWYATFASQSPILPGTHEIVAPLDGNWTAVQRSSARNDQAAFRAAIAAADRVGFVLGGGDGYGHGVTATGPARLTVLGFRVE